MSPDVFFALGDTDLAVRRIMSAKIYVFGTDYKYQREDKVLSKNQLDGFESVISVICVKNKIRLITEEFNLEALKESNLSESFPKKISNSLNLKYIYCDPDNDQRCEFGIWQENYIRASHIMDSATAEQIQSEIQESSKKERNVD